MKVISDPIVAKFQIEYSLMHPSKKKKKAGATALYAIRIAVAHQNPNWHHVVTKEWCHQWPV